MSCRISRREFLGALPALGILGSLPAQSSVRRTLPRRAIPGSSENLPIVGLGSTKPVRYIAEAGTGPIESVLHMLLSYGGCVVDTSPRPAELDEQFGRVLQQPEFSDSLFVCAKVKVSGKAAGIAQIEQTQRLFGRDPLDLLQIESLTDLETQWRTLRDWKETGRARFIGVTVANERHYAALEAFMRRERPDFVQLNYSVMENTAEDRLLPLAEDLGIAILVNGPFMNGEYFGMVKGQELPDWAAEFDCNSWAQFSLKYILAHPAVTCVLTETTKPAHMEDNLQAGFGRLPGDAMKRRMREFAQAI
ncbi:MAG: aldo/keto reductase [Gammaproteobacteria bacterium]|nr:aldo/keto reductase [Gammaproteobacteria bacterium]